MTKKFEEVHLGQLKTGDYVRVTGHHSGFTVEGEITSEQDSVALAGQFKIAQSINIKNYLVDKVEREVSPLPTEPGVYNRGHLPSITTTFYRLSQAGQWFVGENEVTLRDMQILNAGRTLQPIALDKDFI